MSDTPLFTVFTPTYNRGHTIHRVYDSLCAQTLRDFEWLVVDDGSTDGTAELIAKWINVADFPIRYLQQPHSGKHIAHNLAIREARGQLFAVLDSDDALLADSLEKLARSWNSIPASERPYFSGVWGLCCDQYGAVIGDQYPASPFDADLRKVFYVHRVRGEKWCVSRTAVLQQYPFPEIRETQFTPETTLWLEIAKTYKARCVNEVVRKYYIDDDNTGATLSRRMSLGDNAPGRLHHCVWLLNNDLQYFFRSPKPFLKAAVMLPIVARFSGQSFRRSLNALEKFPAKILVCLVFPLASLIYAFDRARRLVRRGATPTLL